MNFRYISRLWNSWDCNSTQYENGRRADTLLEEVIREDEYVDICPNCGGLFSQNARGRRKKFCSDKCRTAWNHRHPNIANWKDVPHYIARAEDFSATREYGQLGKYCSIACPTGQAAEREEHDAGREDGHGIGRPESSHTAPSGRLRLLISSRTKVPYHLETPASICAG